MNAFGKDATAEEIISLPTPNNPPATTPSTISIAEFTKSISILVVSVKDI